MKRLVYYFLLFILFAPTVLLAQLDQLKNMSPDELKKKAAEMGYSEEDFLKYQQLKQQTSEVKEKVDTAGYSKASQNVIPPAPKSPAGLYSSA